MALFGEILLQLKTTVGSWGGLFYIVYLPEWERYARGEPVTKSRDLVLKLAETLDLNVIEPYKDFQARDDPLSLTFREDGRYNERGHRVVAEASLCSISLGSKYVLSAKGPRGILPGTYTLIKLC